MATGADQQTGLSCGNERAEALLTEFRRVRAATESLCEPLETEDYVAQSMDDVSPTKWHLAHTSWFFETFVLEPAGVGYQSPHPRYEFLFNSYYNTVGPQHDRPRRGVLTRPTVAEVWSYRKHVDEQIEQLLDRAGIAMEADLLDVVEIGLHHEQQHQELILTDIKHVLASNPLFPAYREDLPAAKKRGPSNPAWCEQDGRIARIGHGAEGFAYDNEQPRHEVLLRDGRLAMDLVTCGDYLQFIEDDGYQRPDLWLSDGWSAVCQQGWSAPLYWQQDGGQWRDFTLGGLREINAAEPVCHVSFYEADAFARWAGASLPREAAWEVAAEEVHVEGVQVEGNFVERGHFHPAASNGSDDSRLPRQLFGDVWEWTSSPYRPYPGYRAPAGALGEYNGKFMCNQIVLRGGSCATPASHIRPTYRNFFPPDARWQFSGFRLAQEAEQA